MNFRIKQSASKMGKDLKCTFCLATWAFLHNSNFLKVSNHQKSFPKPTCTQAKRGLDLFLSVYSDMRIVPHGSSGTSLWGKGEFDFQCIFLRWFLRHDCHACDYSHVCKYLKPPAKFHLLIIRILYRFLFKLSFYTWLWVLLVTQVSNCVCPISCKNTWNWIDFLNK